MPPKRKRHRERRRCPSQPSSGQRSFRRRPATKSILPGLRCRRTTQVIRALPRPTRPPLARHHLTRAPKKYPSTRRQFLSCPRILSEQMSGQRPRRPTLASSESAAGCPIKRCCCEWPPAARTGTALCPGWPSRVAISCSCCRRSARPWPWRRGFRWRWCLRRSSSSKALIKGCRSCGCTTAG